MWTYDSREGSCHGDIVRGRLERTYVSRLGDMSWRQLAPVLTDIGIISCDRKKNLGNIPCLHEVMKKWLSTEKTENWGNNLKVLQDVTKDRITTVAQ